MILVTRVVIVASTVAAAVVEAYLANSYSPQLFWIALAAFVLMLVTGQRLRAASLPIVMASLYLMPAIFLLTLGPQAGGYGLDVIWILPLLGLILSDRGALEWSLPARWQWPLVTWALLVAIAWPIVFLREADFAVWILPLQRVSNTSVGISPVAGWAERRLFRHRPHAWHSVRSMRCSVGTPTTGRGSGGMC